MKPSCCWKCSLSFNCNEKLSRQTQQKVSQGKGLFLPPRGKETALESLNLLVKLWHSTNGFTDLHRGDAGPVLLPGKVILNHDPGARSGSRAFELSNDCYR